MSICDFLDEAYSKFWCKYKAKKYILKKVKRIDKLSRKGEGWQYCELFSKVVRKSIGATEGKNSLTGIFHKPNLAKKRENCVLMIKYILGVIEKYPLLDEARENLLTNFFGCLRLKTPELCSVNGPEITFNGFKFVSISLYEKPYKVIVFDTKNGEEYQLDLGEHCSGKHLTRLSQVLLRKIAPPQAPETTHYVALCNLVGTDASCDEATKPT